MGAPSAWILYNGFKNNLGLANFNLGSDTVKMALFTSASIAINAAVATATYANFATDGHELANANGYTTAGVAVAVTWTGSSTLTLGAANASWTATGGSLTARAAVLYDSTTGYAIAYMLLDATPADVTVASGNTLTINDSANIFTLT